MDLATQMVNDVADVFLDTTDFAETITVYKTGGGALSITAAIMRNESILPTPSMDGMVRVQQAILDVSTNATTGWEAPAEGDVVEFDSKLWKVQGSPLKDGFGMQRIQVVSIAAREKSDQRYRLTR